MLTCQMYCEVFPWGVLGKIFLVNDVSILTNLHDVISLEHRYIYRVVGV